MKRKSRVLVVSGGASSEREISLRSGTAVVEALRTNGYFADQYDITNQGDELLNLLPNYDIVFPMIHGAGGEDGTIQAILEHEKKPFIGSGSVASGRCFDKQLFKEHLDPGIFTYAPGSVVNFKEFNSHTLTKEPFVLKPKEGGSSIDTYIIRDPKNFDVQQTEKTFAKYKFLLLERLISGHEITVGILGETALPVIEIIPPVNEEFSYKNKYNGKTQELCPPVSVSRDVQLKAQELALSIHDLIGCRQFSRTDMIVTAENELYILETNTIPGMTSESLYPKAARAMGMSLPEVVEILVQSSLSGA
jgi:D-alanine-D-alanine ligase